MVKWGQLYFPDFNSQMASKLFYYHDLALVVVVMMSILVLGFLLLFLFSKVFIGQSMHLKMKKNEVLELWWSTFPFFILCSLGFISLSNLYSMEVGENVGFSVKVTGHQWYWEYGYNVNFSSLNFCDEFDDYVMNYVVCSQINLKEFFSSSEFNNYLLDSQKLSVAQKAKFLNAKPISFPMDINGYSGYYTKALKRSGGDIVSFFVSFSESVFTDQIYKNPLFFVLGWSEGVMSCVDGYLVFCDWGLMDGNSLISVLKGVSSLYLGGDWSLKYDSYIVPEDVLLDGDLVGLNDFFFLKNGFRNQDVSIPCYLVRSSKNEVLVSTADVMHSWGVSELGVKADAVPGRVNALKVVPLRSGLAFGFCYELCGAGHSHMPICVFIVNELDFNWLIKSSVLSTEGVKDFISVLI